MRKTTKMFMMGRGRRIGVDYTDWDSPRSRYDPAGDSTMYRFRDRTGREHYDNGRFAPQSRAGESYSDYDDGITYPENRRRRDSRGRYMTMDEDARSYYDPYIHGGDRPMNRIGFRWPENHEEIPAVGDRTRGSSRERGYASGSGRRYARMDRRTAEEWTRKMKNSDGTRGSHWTMDQTTAELQTRGYDCDPVEFYAAMNMLYSDYAKVLAQNNVANMNMYCDLAKAFLEDEDAVDGKLMAYYDCVVSHD